MRHMCTLVIATLLTTTAWAQESKPNILVIFGDDVGIANVSAYSQGVMGKLHVKLLKEEDRVKSIYQLEVESIEPT